MDLELTELRWISAYQHCAFNFIHVQYFNQALSYFYWQRIIDEWIIHISLSECCCFLRSILLHFFVVSGLLFVFISPTPLRYFQFGIIFINTIKNIYCRWDMKRRKKNNKRETFVNESVNLINILIDLLVKFFFPTRLKSTEINKLCWGVYGSGVKRICLLINDEL